MAKKKMFTVLAIDGGGIRGVIPAVILKEIERRSAKRVAEQFDLIGGTSTGGILALGLTMPDPATPQAPAYTADDLLRFYRDEGPEIFKRSLFQKVRQFFDEGYDHRRLEKALKQRFGDARMGESLTSVMITAYDIERRDTKFLKHRRHGRDGKPHDWNDPDFYMRDVARATSAAPTFFEPALVWSLPGHGEKSERFALIDGFVVATNPALAAFVDAFKMKDPDQDILVVSLGTGMDEEPIWYNDAREWGQLGWLRPVIAMLMQGQTDATHHQLQYLLGGNYYRLDINMRRDDLLADERASTDIDDASPENIRKLERLAERIIAENDQAIDEIVDLLNGIDNRPPGRSWRFGLAMFPMFSGRRRAQRRMRDMVRHMESGPGEALLPPDMPPADYRAGPPPGGDGSAAGGQGLSGKGQGAGGKAHDNDNRDASPARPAGRARRSVKGPQPR